MTRLTIVPVDGSGPWVRGWVDGERRVLSAGTIERQLGEGDGCSVEHAGRTLRVEVGGVVEWFTLAHVRQVVFEEDA